MEILAWTVIWSVVTFVVCATLLVGSSAKRIGGLLAALLGLSVITFIVSACCLAGTVLGHLPK